MAERQHKKRTVLNVPRLKPLQLSEGVEHFKDPDALFQHTGPPPVAGMMVLRAPASPMQVKPKAKVMILNDPEFADGKLRPDRMRLPILKDIIITEQAKEKIADASPFGAGPEGDEPAASGNGTDFSDWERMLDHKSGEDAIAFFARHGNETPIKFVYCNRVSSPGQYRPYDLVVVSRKQVEPEHFMISASGVVHVLPGAPSEFSTLAEWTHSSQLFNILRSIRFFKHYLITKMFQLWRRNVRFRLFAKQRKHVCNSLFMARPSFSRHLIEVNKTLQRFDAVQLIDVKPDGLAQEQSTFTNAQNLKREQAQKLFQHIAEELITTVEEVCKKVQARSAKHLKNAGGEDPHGKFANPVSNAGNRMQSMVQAKTEQAERFRRLKHAKQEVDLLGDFVRLVDYMQLAKLVSRVTDTEADFFDVMESTKKPLFQTTVSFKPGKFEYNPTREKLLEMVREMSNHVIDVVVNVERVIDQSKFNHLVKGFVDHSRKISEIIMADRGFNGTKAAVDAKLTRDFDKAAKMAFMTLEEYRHMYNFDDEWLRQGGLQRYMESDKHTVQSMEEDIKQKTKWMSDVEIKIHNSFPYGVISVQTLTTIINVLKPIIERALDSMKKKLYQTFQLEAKALEASLKAKNEKLKPSATMGLNDFARFVENFNIIMEGKEQVARQYSNVVAMNVLMQSQNPPLKLETSDTVVYQNVEQDYITFGALLEDAKAFRDLKLAEQIERVKKRNDATVKKLALLLDKLDEGILIEEQTKPEDALAKLREIENAPANQDGMGLAELIKQVETQQGYQRLFGADVYKFDELPKVTDAFNNKLKLWQTAADFKQKIREYEKTDFQKELPVETMNSEIQNMFLSVYALNKGFRKKEVSIDLLKQIEKYKSIMPMIVRLGNKAMKQVHWQKLYKAINKPLAANAKLSLSSMRKDGLFNYVHEINEITEAAEGEFALEATLDAMDKNWSKIDFIVQPYKNSKMHLFSVILKR